VSLPHLSADVLALQYLNLYRKLVRSEMPVRNAESNRASSSEIEMQSFESDTSSRPAEEGGIHGCV
jgi:hypothetical protein